MKKQKKKKKAQKVAFFLPDGTRVQLGDVLLVNIPGTTPTLGVAHSFEITETSCRILSRGGTTLFDSEFPHGTIFVAVADDEHVQFKDRDATTWKEQSYSLIRMDQED